MRNIWNIFRADWRRLTASVVAVVVLLGLCLVPCLYAWFNILSNWDPYGVASTSRIKVAVASEDQGYQVMGLELNIGELVLQGLESNDQMGWVFVDDADTALSGVESGEYYAALVVPEEFTGDFVSILTGDLRHPQIQYYENEKKNAIAPKITSKAKTAVQEQINTTVVGKAAEALTTVGTVCKAMGLDSQDLADGIMDKLTSARQETAQIQKVLVSLKDVMDGADSLLAAASVTIRDAQSAIDALNEKYGGGFYLFTRQRSYNGESYSGRERKRGALIELARLLCGEDSELSVTGDEAALRGTRYIITLDADTRIYPGSLSLLIGAAMHPLCTPVIDEGSNVVVSGHAIIHPRIETELESANSTDFSLIFAGAGGCDPYCSLCGELYMDAFGSGGFAGKGLIDPKALLRCTAGRFPDGRILSHDALEGAYLRGAYMSDAEFSQLELYPDFDE